MDPNTAPVPASGALATLLDRRQSFLRYLERRTGGNRDLAEDLLHDAFTKVVIEPGLAPDDDAVVPWFYRLLRNAVVARHHRQAHADKAFVAFARELESHEEAPAEVEAEICACVARLSRSLKPEYAEALLAIEVENTSVATFAERKGLTPGQAAGRVCHAREALKMQVTESCGACAAHGCLLCSCEGDD